MRLIFNLQLRPDTFIEILKIEYITTSFKLLVSSYIKFISQPSPDLPLFIVL